MPATHSVSLEFRRPALTDRDAFASWIADWTGDPYDAYRWIFARAWIDFDWYVALCERIRTAGCPPQLQVPLDVYWAFSGPVLAGELYVFYEPMNGDNHIGYKVRPSCRRKGIASALLARGLAILDQRGIETALVTCRDTNLASAAVIERGGGVRLGEKVVAGEVFRRYAITTGAG